LTGDILLSMGAAATSVNFWYDAPPRIGSDAEFAAARRVFDDAGYTYGNLCARLGVERLYEYMTPPVAELLAQPVDDSLDVIYRLFGHGLHLERSIVESFLGAEGRAALAALHLLEADPDAPQMDYAPAIVLPFLDVLTMTDRFCSPSGEKIEVPADSVYPALFSNTYDFVSRLPKTECEALLDLGTGTGAAAICQAGFARRVWAADITARSVHFAEFNSRLNGCANIQGVTGDLYEPVSGLTFDRIVSQPPYIAVAADKIVYRDGGPDGEQVIRRIVEGLPEYLRPGGMFCALLMATDREGETFEQRIRKWLGESAAEFDVLLACDLVKDPMEFLLAAQKIPVVEKEYRRVLYEKTRTSAVLSCSIVLRRKVDERPAVTVRAMVGRNVTGQDLNSLLEWHAAVASPEGPEMLWKTRPKLGAHCELHVAHRVRGGRLMAEEFVLQTNGPFVSKGKTPAWVAQLVTQCDGSKSWGERFGNLQAEGRVPAGLTREDFVNILSVLVSTGVLEVSENSVVFDEG
jgi:SAM-dependent methyltransferase